MKDKLRTEGVPVKTDVRDRHVILLEEYRKTGNLTQSAIKAGFTPLTANKCGRSLLETALKRERILIEKKIENGLMTRNEKKKAFEVLGLTRENLIDNIKWLLEQEKDLSVRYKIVAKLGKDIGVDLSDDDSNKPIAPTLNIGIVNKQSEPTDTKKALNVAI